MVLFIMTIILEYLVSALIVGYVFFVFLERSGKQLSIMQKMPILFLVFLILDIYDYPALRGIDFTIIFNDPSIIKFLGASEISGKEFLTLEMSDLVVWCLQTFVAFLVGIKLGYQRKSQPGLPI